jgi:DNA-directed RNA polymerase beta subunit
MPSRATERINFGKIKEIVSPPNMIELQTNSYAEFLQADSSPKKRLKHTGFYRTEIVFVRLRIWFLGCPQSNDFKFQKFKEVGKCVLHVFRM